MRVEIDKGSRFRFSTFNHSSGVAGQHGLTRQSLDRQVRVLADTAQCLSDGKLLLRSKIRNLRNQSAVNEHGQGGNMSHPLSMILSCYSSIGYHFSASGIAIDCT
jgi:hypothetical protein